MKPRRLRPDEIDRERERKRIVASFDVFGVPQAERDEILEALMTTDQRQAKADAAAGGKAPPVHPWDWFTNCDGCTGVSEDFWPTKYFPPCLRHDFDWYTGNNVAQANARFYRLSRRYGFTKARAAVRWAGVTLAWYAFFKWRRMVRRLAGDPNA